MGKRKVLNKYFPVDFDPKKFARRRHPKNQQTTVRMMLPMSIRCANCGNYMYKGTKFNSRKEVVIGETYVGIKIFRFYFKCTKCCAEITYKTDSKNSDYTVESGATRNFEPWREMDKEKQKRDTESMKSLENRTLDSERRMDIDAGLDELKSFKARQATVSIDAMLEANLQQKTEDLEDEARIRSVVFGRARDGIVKRIHDKEFDNDDDDLVSENKSVKRRKFSFEEKPTHFLTKASLSVSVSSNNNREKASASGELSSIKLSVVKKIGGNKQWSTIIMSTI